VCRGAGTRGSHSVAPHSTSSPAAAIYMMLML
jgi:hypothetical protein